jgi:hypothetical protein
MKMLTRSSSGPAALATTQRRVRTQGATLKRVERQLGGVGRLGQRHAPWEGFLLLLRACNAIDLPPAAQQRDGGQRSRAAAE